MFIKLKSNVKHNGEDYLGGQTVEMDDRSAQILIDSNVAEKASAPKAEASKASAPKAEEKKASAPKAEEKDPVETKAGDKSEDKKN